MSASIVRIAGKEVRLSNLDKPLYPSGFTKAQVIDYYRQIAPLMLPHLKGRPVSFKRFPNGTGATSFFQKNRPDSAPPWVKSITLRGREGDDVDYCLIDNLPSLIWAANSAALEFHVPLAKAKTPNHPDALVFDLDPGAPATILDCARLALHLRELLDAMRLQSFVKSSGSKGLHLLVPLRSQTTFDQSREFGHHLAATLAREDPDHVTATMAKNQRPGKVFVDWNQNAPQQTTVCAYSLRGTPTPNVSTPLLWKEVEQAVAKSRPDLLIFTAPQVLQRIQKQGDLFADLLTLKQRLPKSRLQNAASIASTPFSVAPEGRASRSKPASQEIKAPADLRDYKAKRDFHSTPEPRAIVRSRSTSPRKPLTFCVQKHLASHLHYDFRLEHHGVLLSWAIPKGPSLRPSDKRLAMRVEDHPVDYADFEGVIPAGYGAGIVLLWDRGAWQPEVPDVDAALEKGELKFSLDGVKLKGSWALIRTRARNDSRAWLLIKHRDAWAGDVDVTQAAPLSVKSFGDFPDILAAHPASHLPERGGAAGALLEKVKSTAPRKRSSPRSSQKSG